MARVLGAGGGSWNLARVENGTSEPVCGCNHDRAIFRLVHDPLTNETARPGKPVATWATLYPTTRRVPLRAGEAAAGFAGVSRQRIAISRLATPSSPVTAGTPPERTASTNAINSARNGSPLPTGRKRIAKPAARLEPK